jgi:hypothetical protein
MINQIGQLISNSHENVRWGATAEFHVVTEFIVSASADEA